MQSGDQVKHRNEHHGAITPFKGSCVANSHHALHMSLACEEQMNSGTAQAKTQRHTEGRHVWARCLHLGAVPSSRQQMHIPDTQLEAGIASRGGLPSAASHFIFRSRGCIGHFCAGKSRQGSSLFCIAEPFLPLHPGRPSKMHFISIWPCHADAAVVAIACPQRDHESNMAR